MTWYPLPPSTSHRSHREQKANINDQMRHRTGADHNDEGQKISAERDTYIHVDVYIYGEIEKDRLREKGRGREGEIHQRVLRFRLLSYGSQQHPHICVYI
eukprot:3449929-Pyramimonas_sp.AAC.1